MLKLGSVRWRGKCSRHPGFDPYTDGLGAVRGGCVKCQMLWDISEHHRKMLVLMRSFAPPVKPKRVPKPGSDEERQITIFDLLDEEPPAV